MQPFTQQTVCGGMNAITNMQAVQGDDTGICPTLYLYLVQAYRSLQVHALGRQHGASGWHAGSCACLRARHCHRRRVQRRRRRPRQHRPGKPVQPLPRICQRSILPRVPPAALCWQACTPALRRVLRIQPCFEACNCHGGRHQPQAELQVGQHGAALLCNAGQRSVAQGWRAGEGEEAQPVTLDLPVGRASVIVGGKGEGGWPNAGV